LGHFFVRAALTDQTVWLLAARNYPKF
jgi:hypothetical protein